MNIPSKTSVPADSRAEHLIHGSYFYDSWKIQAALPELDPLSQFIRVLSTTPKWIDSMMILRNCAVGLVGLKNLGTLSGLDFSKPSSEYMSGDRVGIFTLIENSEQEVLLGDDDKHLNVVLSVHMGVEASSAETVVTVTTVVHVKNWLGRLYMVPVIPAHYVIARTMTKAIGNTA